MVAKGRHLTHKTETYKTNMVGEKTTKLSRTKVENDWLGRLLKLPKKLMKCHFLEALAPLGQGMSLVPSASQGCFSQILVT